MPVSTGKAVLSQDIPPNDIPHIDSEANPDSEEIRAWLIGYLAELLEVSPSEIDTSLSFDQYGLDSSTAIGITGDLSDWLHRDLDPVLLYYYPTVDALVQHLEMGLETALN